MSQNLIGGYELVAMEECSLPEQVAAGNKKTIRGGTDPGVTDTGRR